MRILRRHPRAPAAATVMAVGVVRVVLGALLVVRHLVVIAGHGRRCFVVSSDDGGWNCCGVWWSRRQELKREITAQ